MAHIFNPLLDGENFDEIDLGDTGVAESDTTIDRVIIDEKEYPELFGTVFAGNFYWY
uniref:Uncharacterized protein n=1 Tax=viral metagenome TaxID=1070528 RepID=A0A6M3JZW2_9ZZZZ